MEPFLLYEVDLIKQRRFFVFLNFRDHPINFGFEKFTFEREDIKEVQDIKKTYIEANKFLQGAVAYAGKKLYIDNINKEKNILLQFAQNVSYRYFIILKGIFYYQLLSSKQEKKEQNVIAKVKDFLEKQVAKEKASYWLGHLSDHEKLFNILSNSHPVNEGVAEFRYRLYFVYKMMPQVEKYILKNEVTHNKSSYDEIRHYVKRSVKNWKINKDYVQELVRRSQIKNSKYILYCPGSAAEINTKELRRDSDENSPIFRKKKDGLKMPTYRQVLFPELSNRKSYDIRDFIFNNLNFSKDEIQEMTKRRYSSVLTDDQLLDTVLNANSGATTYDYNENTQNAEARKFLDMSDEGYMPRISGISGTMDYSISMALIVGFGVYNKQIDYNYIHVIKLAYIVWMTQANDHTLHEMLFSSLSYGLNYIPGPNVIDYVLPNNQEFKNKVHEVMRLNNLFLPIHYYNDYCLFLKRHLDLFNKYKFALKTISSCSAVGRMIGLNNLEVEIANLKDPTNSKYGTYQENKKDRSKPTYEIYTPDTKEMMTKNFNPQPRGDKKYTKKLATTIIRADGMTNFYGSQNVGVMFNMIALNTKEYRYVFTQDVQSNTKWWIGDANYQRNMFENSFININVFRSILLYKSMNKKDKDSLNEALFGLCKEALIALFIQVKDSGNRNKEILMLVYFYFYIKKNLKISLPILEFIFPDKGATEFSYVEIVTVQKIVTAFAEIIYHNGFQTLNKFLKRGLTEILNDLNFPVKNIGNISEAEFKFTIGNKLSESFTAEVVASEYINYYNLQLKNMYSYYSNSRGTHTSLISDKFSELNTPKLEIAGAQTVPLLNNKMSEMPIPQPPPLPLDLNTLKKENSLEKKYKHVKNIFNTENESIFAEWKTQ